MGLIKEPEDIDFYVVDKDPSPEELKMVSDYIAEYKMNNKDKTGSAKPSKKSATKEIKSVKI